MPDPSIPWLSLFPPGARVTAFPSWNRVRLVTREDGPVTPSTLVRFFPAGRTSARLYRAWLRLRARMVSAPTRALRCDGTLEPVVRELCSSAEVAAVIPDRNGRSRAVAVALDHTGSIVAYLKYGWSEADSRRLAREAAMLGTLPEGSGPRLLGSATVANGLLLVLEALNGTPVPASLPPPTDLVAFLRALEREHLLGNKHPKLLALAAMDAASAKRPWADALACIEVPVGFCHGDLAPWNLIRTPSGLVAVDWESGETDGLPWLDIAHYVLQTAALMHRWSPHRAASFGVRYLTRALHVDTGQARAVLALSAYAAWAAAVEEGTQDGAWLQVWRRAIWTDKSCGA